MHTNCFNLHQSSPINQSSPIFTNCRRLAQIVLLAFFLLPAGQSLLQDRVLPDGVLAAPSLVFADEPLDQIIGLGTYQTKPLDRSASTVELIISNTVGFFTVTAGLTFVIYVVLAGLTWITSREEAERISRAKQMLTNALVGLAIVAISWAFTGIMETVFGFNILNPADIINNVLTPKCTPPC